MNPYAVAVALAALTGLVLVIVYLVASFLEGKD